jgi:ACT domain-containing protein
MKKVIITVVGVDTVGIIAGISAYLARNKVNILDISQTVVGGFFNMMMVVDGSASTKTFDKLFSDLDKAGKAKGLEIRCQKSEIFEKMHRV